MTLTNLRRFYEQVTPEALEAYLRDHGWLRYRQDKYKSRWDLLSGQTLTNSLYAPTREFLDYGEMMDDAVHALAKIERRQESGVLYDLLPASARADFVREILPQVAK